MEDKIKELKSQAYDAMVQIENWQRNLRTINDEIAKLQVEKNDLARKESNEKENA